MRFFAGTCSGPKKTRNDKNQLPHARLSYVVGSIGDLIAFRVVASNETSREIQASDIPAHASSFLLEYGPSEEDGID